MRSRLTQTPSGRYLGRRAAVLGLLLAFAPAGIAEAQMAVPTVSNGRRGSMRTAPAISERATAGVEGPEASILYQPSGLLFDTEGNAYVPDRGNKAILVYDRNGRFLRRIGGEGSGPGELQSPMGAYFSSDGLLVVPDPMNQRTTFYRSDGEYVRSEPLGQNGMIVIGSGRIPLGDGTYLQAGSGSGMMVVVQVSEEGVRGVGRPDMPEPAVVDVLDRDGKRTRSFGEMKTHEDARVNRLINRTNLAYDPGSGEVAVVYSYSADIRIYDLASGDLKRIITRELPFTPREPSLEEVRNSSADGMEVRVMLQPVADRVSYGAAYDADGRLWVITSTMDLDQANKREEEGDYSNMVRLEVFGQDGRLLTTIDLDEPADTIAFDPQGALWLVDSEYVSSLRRFRVDWP